MTDEQYAAHRKMCDEFTEWRKAEAKKLPELAARVFALRGRGYYGCGFHWSMECKLGTVIARLNDYDNGANYYGPEAIHYQIPLQVMVKELYGDVARAEESAGWYIGTSPDEAHPGIISGPFRDRPALQCGQFLYMKTRDREDAITWRKMG